MVLMINNIFDVQIVAQLSADPAAMLKSNTLFGIDKDPEDPAMLFSSKLHLDKLKAHGRKKLLGKITHSVHY